VLVSNSEVAVVRRRGIVEARIRIAIRIEARGSNPDQLKCLIRSVEIITPTEPSVSANTWRNILLVSKGQRREDTHAYWNYDDVSDRVHGHVRDDDGDHG